MAKAPLSSPGHRPPRQGHMRGDITIRVVMLAVITIVTTVGMLSLWLAGQIGGLISAQAWPDSGPADAPGIAFRLARHLGDPATAWPAAARPDVAPPWLLYPLWLLLFGAMLTSLLLATARIGRRRIRRAGFAIVRTTYVWQTFEGISQHQPALVGRMRGFLRGMANLMERVPVAKALGVSQVIVARKPGVTPAANARSARA